MSTIDDARTLIQDIVVPDLKALAARVDALEKATLHGFEANEKLVTQRFEAVEQRFGAVEKLAEARHDLLVVRMDAGFAAMDAKLSAAFAAIEARFAAADARFDSILKAINIDRRLELLEAAQAKDAPRPELHA